MKINRIFFGVFLALLILISVSMVNAYEISEDLKAAVMKTIEKAARGDSVMDREDIRKEVLSSMFSTASLHVAASKLVSTYHKGDIGFVETFLLPVVRNAPMPVFEKTICFLALKDVALLEGDKNKAQKYLNMAQNTTKEGIEYYTAMAKKGSVIALYNLYVYDQLLRVLSPTYVSPVTKKDMERVERILSEMEYIQERNLALIEASSLWDAELAKIRGTKATKPKKK